MPFSGQEVSQKGFPRGWDADAEDQASQRQFRIAQLLEAMVFRPFSWDRFKSLNLKYAWHGGYIDAGDRWLLIDNGSVTLQDGATNFIERSDAGQVTVNQTAFRYTGFIPMAQIEARNGAFVPTSYIDRRPEIGGAPATDVGAIGFAQILGQILANQVPLDVVQQWQFDLCILAGNILPGTFGALASCNPGSTGDWTFPRDLGILQDLFVGRDAVVTEDLAVLENMNVLGIFTAEGVAFLEDVTTLQSQDRRGIRTITAADTPYTLVEADWHLNVDISLGSVEVLIPDAAAHFTAGFTDQLHFKIIGSGFGEPFVTLTPSVGGQLVDGFEEAILRRNNLSFTLVSDGTGWWIQ